MGFYMKIKFVKSQALILNNLLVNFFYFLPNKFNAEYRKQSSPRNADKAPKKFKRDYEIIKCMDTNCQEQIGGNSKYRPFF